MTEKHDRFAFFRQSSWMVIATVGGGLCMVAVQHLSKKQMLPGEYDDFYILLRLIMWLGIPTAGLQTIFAQQAAAALTEERQRELRSAARSVLKVTFAVWVIIAVVMTVGCRQVKWLLNLGNLSAIWPTIGLCAVGLPLPILKGLLQGRHHFAGLGWVQIMDGVGRVSAAFLILVLLSGQAAGGMLAALIGQGAAFLLGAWLTRDFWKDAFFGDPVPAFHWGGWLGRVIPLTLGLGAVTFISSCDSIFVKNSFSPLDDTLYNPANLVGFASIQFITPMASVMFSRVVRSAARAEKSDALGLTLTASAVLGAAGALFCTVFPAFPLQVIYGRNSAALQSAFLVPWFMWALLPLTLANVLITNLLAHERYRSVPWLVIVSMSCLGTLVMLRSTLLAMPTHQALEMVVATLGGFSLLLGGVAAWFTWKKT